MNKKLLLVVFLGVVIIGALVTIPLLREQVGKISTQAGDMSEKEKIKTEFITSLARSQNVSEEAIQQVAGEYDVKSNDYFVTASYKNEPGVVYMYQKTQNGGFKFVGVVGDAQNKSPEELSNDHIFSS